MRAAFQHRLQNGEYFPLYVLLALCAHAAFAFLAFAVVRSLYEPQHFGRPRTFELVMAPPREEPPRKQQASKPRPPRPKPEPAPPKTETKEPAPKPEPDPAPVEQTAAAEEPTAPAQAPAAAREPVMDFDAVFEENQADKGPMFLSGPSPAYPMQARDLNIEGVVKVEFIIDRSGMVQEVKVISSPHRSLAREVARKVRRWKFRPAQYRGRSVRIRVRKDIAFQLQ
ncbi:MAG: TonB family protein [Chitinivibrionales bacterium]|nr:TonB family protein [Chitinivibrionales bacterium]MBD3394354.1 TonB family protein [Chitinivibrionales bacterium]